jgi:hypothetical protein
MPYFGHIEDMHGFWSKWCFPVIWCSWNGRSTKLVELVSNKHIFSISWMKCRYVGSKYMQFLTTNTKLERLFSTRLLHGNQKITTRHAMALNKTNELVSLLAPTLSTIKQVISHLKLFNIIWFTFYYKHAKVSNTIWLIIINHDYKVVINIHDVLIQHNGVTILQNDCNEQVLPISKGITKTQANLNLARVETWQHGTCRLEEHYEWQQFTTWSKSRARSYLTLVSSSTRIPRQTHRGWPDTIPYIIHKEVRYRPTRWHTKLLSLWDPKKSLMRQYATQTCSPGPDDRSLINSGGGLPPQSSEFEIKPLILLPIQYSPLSPNCPTQSQIMPTSPVIHLNHIEPPK